MSSTSTRWAFGCSSCFGCLGVLIVLSTGLAMLFYAEEDWRGAHELAAAEARWQAAGYSLKASDYYPPTVPDKQNLAALPIFQLEPDPKDQGRYADLRLRHATDEDEHGGALNDYEHKQELATLVSKAYAKHFPGKTPPTSSLAQLEELYPVISDLRTAAKTRPSFRLKMDYSFQPPWNRSFGPIVTQIRVAKVLSYDAKLASRENRPQVALDDIRLGLQIARGVGQDPSLIGGLVTLGDCAIMRTTIDDGLAKHTWTDAQLATVQDELKRVDCLGLYPFDMRSEVVMMSLPIYQMLKTNPSTMNSIQAGEGELDEDTSTWPLSVWSLWATGWWNMNAAKTLDVMLNAAECDDLNARLVNPERLRQLDSSVDKAKEFPRPWNILFAISAGPVTRALEKFAQSQVQLDEDRIVCGLERYRLVHGGYPDKLEVLVPACIDELPHDIMNGEAYHYRLNADGTFLLYSVGWNQVDDGGEIVFKEDGPKSIDFTQGDWVWPMVKR